MGFLQLIQEQQRHLHGHAVGRVGCGTGRGGVEFVGERQLKFALHPRLGEGGRIQIGFLRHDHVRIEIEQSGILVPGILPPFIEVPLGDHLRAHTLVVELEECLVIHTQITAAHAGFQFLNLGQDSLVAVEELMVGMPITLHQGMANEQLAAQFRINAPIVDTPVRHNGNPVEGDLLMGHDRAHFLGPVRLTIAALDQIRGHLFGPQRIELGGRACPQPGRLHQFGGHDPVRGLLEQGRAREHHELAATGAGVFTFALVVEANVTEQSGQQRHVDGVMIGYRVNVLSGDLNIQRLAHLLELGEQILPLAHAQVIDEFGLAQAPECAGGQLRLLVLDVAPQVQKACEVRVLVNKALVFFGGNLGFVSGAFTRVLNSECRGEHHHLGGNTAFGGLHNHASQPRVYRQLGELASHTGDGTGGGHGTELAQERHAVGDGTGVRRLHERELFHVLGTLGHAHGRHLQNDGG